MTTTPQQTQMTRTITPKEDHVSLYLYRVRNLDSLKKGEIIKNHIYVNENKNISSGNYSGQIGLFYDDNEYDNIEVKIEVLSEDETIVGNDNDTEEDITNEEVKEDNTTRTLIILGSIVVLIGVLILTGSF